MQAKHSKPELGEKSVDEALGEFLKAVAFEPDHEDEWEEWVWRLEDGGHFWAWGRWLLERVVLVVVHQLGH